MENQSCICDHTSHNISHIASATHAVLWEHQCAAKDYVCATQHSTGGLWCCNAPQKVPRVPEKYKSQRQVPMLGYAAGEHGLQQRPRPHGVPVFESYSTSIGGYLFGTYLYSLIKNYFVTFLGNSYFILYILLIVNAKQIFICLIFTGQGIQKFHQEL